MLRKPFFPKISLALRRLGSLLVFLLPAQDSFYKVQGGETGLASQFLSGNIPLLADVKMVRIALIGLFFLVLATRVYRIVSRRRAHNQLGRGQAAFWSLVIFLGFFFVWETAASLPYFSSEQPFIPDPITYWKANPRLLAESRSSGIGVVGIDREAVTGIFDHDYDTEKPPNTYRIVFMGDSQAISYKHFQYAPEICYPKKFELNLKADNLCGPDQKEIQVIDGAISGYSSWQGLMLLKSDILPLKPDLVIEAFGYHDSNHAICYDKDVITDSRLTWTIRKLMYSSNICLAIRTLSLRLQAQSTDAQPYSTDDLPRVSLEDYAKNLTSFVELGKQHNFQVAFFIEPLRDSNAAAFGFRHRNVALETGNKLGVTVIDAYAKFNELDYEASKVCFTDAIHLTPDGHEVAARLVQKTLLDQGILQKKK